MASVESLVEAFARGLAHGFAAAQLTETAPLPQSGKGRRRHTSRKRAVVRHDSPPSPEPQLIFEQPEMPAPPVTQAEMDRMERVLRGESDAEHYAPGEGVAPWQGS